MGVAIRSALVHSLSYLDINLDAWRAKAPFLNFTEIDVSKPVNFTLTPINDATYYEDMDWMQQQVSLAGANDRPIGQCPWAVPPGTVKPNFVPCRYTECAIGSWWAQLLYEYTGADVALINGGAFIGGFPQGVERTCE